MSMRRTRGVRVLGTVCVAALIFSACDSSPSGPAEPVVASVTITPSDPAIVAGQTVQLTATARAADGTTIPGKTFTWQSQNAAVASVSGSGLVTGVQAGTATVSASVDGRSGQVTVVVTAPSPVVVAGVTPATLEAGVTATITGEGFSPTAAGNTVRIGGTVAQVVNATSTSLTVTVPATVCRPTGDIVVQVVVAGSAGQRTHPWRSGPPHEVAVGQQLRLTPAQVFCLQLGAAAGTSEYLIGVQSVSEAPTSLTPVVVSGSTPGSAPPAAVAGAQLLGPSSLHRHPVMVALEHERSEQAERLASHRRAEVEMRQRDLAFLATRSPASLRATRATAQLNGGGEVAAGVPSGAVVGDTVNVKVPDGGNACQGFTQIRAVVRRVGEHGLWVEDVANPAGGFTDAHYQALGSQFDSVIMATNIDYFGQPTDFDDNGVVVIVVTKEVNRQQRPNTRPLGMMNPNDFIPAECPASNNGEYFYNIAPDPNGVEGRPYSLENALRDMPFILAHEMTHVIQFGRRMTTPGATLWPSIWELEGQATLAEEVVGHAVTGNRPGQNYGFDVAWNVGQQTPVDWYRNAFTDMALYFGFESPTASVAGAPEQCGWLSHENSGPIGPCIGRPLFYGVAWSFLRWLSDHHGASFPGGEQGLHKALITDGNRSGFATIRGVVGEEIDVLLAQWAAMLYLDDRLPGADTRLTLPSWNLADIASRLVEPARLTPRDRGFTPFSDGVSVRAASTAYFRVQGTAHPAAAISVTGTQGGALPSHMRVWVVRIR
jgi:hypothetical protein